MSARRTGSSVRGGGHAELQGAGSRPEFVGVGSSGDPGSSLITQERLAGLGCGSSGGATVGSVRSLWGRAEPTAAAPGGRKTGGASPQLCDREPQTRRTRCRNADAVDAVSSERHSRGARCRRGGGRGAQRAKQAALLSAGAGAGWPGDSWSRPPRCSTAQQMRPLQTRAA